MAAIYTTMDHNDDEDGDSSIDLEHPSWADPQQTETPKQEAEQGSEAVEAGLHLGEQNETVDLFAARDQSSLQITCANLALPAPRIRCNSAPRNWRWKSGPLTCYLGQRRSRSSEETMSTEARMRYRTQESVQGYHVDEK